MTSKPSPTSCRKLSCLKTPPVRTEPPALGPGCFPLETLGFLSKLVLLECVWSTPGVSVCWPFVLTDVRWE